MKNKRKLSAFIAGMLSGVMLIGCGTAALAATGGEVTFGRMGLTINGRAVIQAEETMVNANGCEIPSAIVYTDEQGGDTTYLSIRAISELLDIPVSWEPGMVYLGYKPSSGSDITISNSIGSPELWAERPLHRAGAKAGPYTELEPYWPSEEEVESWKLLNVPLSDRFSAGGTYYPLEGEGYCAISVTNTTGRDLVFSISCPATITRDYFPDTVIPAGETAVRTFYAAPYTGGLFQRGLTFALRCDPVFADGEIKDTVSATVSMVGFTKDGAD